MSAAGPGRTDVAVVGAGLAGLQAAACLARAGLDVTVLEARDRVGGRAFSIDSGRGAIDLGGTWFWPGEEAVRTTADALGLTTFPQHISGDALLESGPADGVQRLAGNPIDVPSQRLAEGVQALAHHLADRLPAGALRLGQPVSAITAAANGVRVDARGGSVLADHVVVAVPPPTAVERIHFTPDLPADVHAAATRTAVWMAAIVKAVAVYDQPFWRAAGLSGAAMSYVGPFQELHDHTGQGGETAAIFGFAPAARLAHLDLDAIAPVFRDQLVRLFGPEAAASTAVHVADWSRERYTAPRRPSHQASTATYGAAAFQRPVNGSVHWASTETATSYAGHLEGALRAGQAAAKRILQAP